MKADLASLYRPLIAVAVQGADALPAVERADIFEGIAHLSRRFDPEMSAQAQELAESIRTAEGLQLHFRNLFATS